jgi:hypothetical protein
LWRDKHGGGAGRWRWSISWRLGWVGRAARNDRARWTYDIHRSNLRTTNQGGNERSIERKKQRQVEEGNANDFQADLHPTDSLCYE